MPSDTITIHPFTFKETEMTTYSTFEQTPIATNYVDFQHTMFVLFQGLCPEWNSHYWEMWTHMEPTEQNWHEFLYDIAKEKI